MDQQWYSSHHHLEQDNDDGVDDEDGDENVLPSSYIKLPGTHPELAVADLPILIPVHRLDHVVDFSKSYLLK